MVSSYVRDAHLPKVASRMVHRPRIWLTPFHRAEVAHAIFLHIFYRKLTQADAALAWTSFEQDAARGVWIAVDLPEKAWETSIDLARRHGPLLGVRTLDSLHVASALELRAQKFWTFDERQARLAEAVGLDTTP